MSRRFHYEVGDVELEAHAFEAEPLHGDLLFAQANGEANDFVVKAGREAPRATAENTNVPARGGNPVNWRTVAVADFVLEN